MINHTHHVIRYIDGKRRSVSISVGGLYEYRPSENGAEAQDGRICRVEGFDDELLPHKARVRFQDNGRIGLVNLNALLEADDLAEASLA
ncbi:MAG: hypothetical protein SYC29_05665 [Planctomycetota bacterium]|nr:hypothetical protein [Planctomycetota bacterium]